MKVSSLWKSSDLVKSSWIFNSFPCLTHSVLPWPAQSIQSTVPQVWYLILPIGRGPRAECWCEDHVKSPTLKVEGVQSTKNAKIIPYFPASVYPAKTVNIVTFKNFSVTKTPWPIYHVTKLPTHCCRSMKFLGSWSFKAVLRPLPSDLPFSIYAWKQPCATFYAYHKILSHYKILESWTKMCQARCGLSALTQYQFLKVLAF